MSHVVLRGYYAHIGSLRQYLRAITDLEDLAFIDNNERLAALVLSITVASRNPWQSHTRHHAEPAQTDLSEIIELAQRRIFAESLTGAPDNVLTYGYRKATSTSSNGGKIDSVRNHKLAWVNTNVTFLSSPIWGRILASIGEGAMLDLLTVPSLFIDLGNNCLSQLTGTPIFDLQRSLPSLNKKRIGEEPPPGDRSKRLRMGAAPHNASSLKHQVRVRPRKRSAADIYIPRVSVFYGKPMRRQNGRVAIGLPKYHVLNMPANANDKAADGRGGPTSEPKKEPTITPASGPLRSKKEMEMEKTCRHLSKHVFPREYGLPNVFLPENLWERFTLLARESHIKRLGNCKTPKRVKQSLPLFQKLVKLHAAFDYSGWCGRICPSKLKATPRPEPDTLDESVMDMMHRPHTQIPPSTLDASHESMIVPHGASQAKAECKNKPRFADFAFSHSQVTRYVIHCVKAVIPRAFWGSDHNFQLTCSNIRKLIQARRHETLSLHEALQGFKIGDCDSWLGTASKRAKQQRSSVSDAIKRRELLEEFIYWFFESFVLPLLRTTFYVTESAAFQNHILYFRQDDWDVLTRPLIDTLAAKTFRKIAMPEAEVQDILKQRRLSFSFVRLLPKETGIRPIVNLRKVGQDGKSINRLLLAAFQILNYEKIKQPDLLGAAVFSHNEMYKKIGSFKDSLSGPHRNRQLPTLYFVKVDVRACFDTIDQVKLLEILRSLIRRDKYVIVKYGKIVPNLGQNKRTFEGKACGTTDHVLFVHYAKQLAESLRNAVFVDKVMYDKESRAEILELLEEHIKENVVKIGKSYYKQVVGIPQGSVLSSLLCSFFYGDLEEKRMQWHKDPDCLTLRWIDDYLFITSNKEKAFSFLEIMSDGHPDYGCFISTEKTLTNFWCDKHQPNIVAVDAQAFPWCGLMFNMKNLNVSADYGRYSGRYVADFLTVATNRHAGSAFGHKMAKMVTQRAHPIFTDMNFNSAKVVHLNVFHNYVLTAMKMHHYIKTWGVDVNKHHRFIWGVLQRSFQCCSRAILNRSKTGPRIDTVAVHWLGLYAFHEILSRKPTAYTSLLQDIKFAMRSPLYDRTRRRLEPLVKRHEHDLDSIKW